MVFFSGMRFLGVFEEKMDRRESADDEKRMNKRSVGVKQATRVQGSYSRSQNGELFPSGVQGRGANGPRRIARSKHHYSNLTRRIGA
jgi:hypothetical protein